MIIDRAESIVHFLEFCQGYLADPSIGEIIINRPYEIAVESDGAWFTYSTDKSNQDLVDLCTAIAWYNDTDVSDIRPIMQAILPDGQRIHVVMPPASEHISITIRKPSDGVIDIYDYKLSYFGSDIVRDNLIKCVKDGKTVIVAGETGSGKSTLLKSLAGSGIDEGYRLITIEDTAELFIENSHPNSVAMFYGKAEVTANDCLKSCLRMKPDRIILGECRSGEAMTLLNVLASGHSGSMTSLHAGSCSLAIERLALMAMQSEEGRALGYDAIKRMINLVVDVVVHVTNDSKGRRITEVVEI